MQQARAEVSYEQLTIDGKPEWWYTSIDPEVRAALHRAMYPRFKPVTCEPCKAGGGPADCVRPCVTYSRPRGERLLA